MPPRDNDDEYGLIPATDRNDSGYGLEPANQSVPHPAQTQEQTSPPAEKPSFLRRAWDTLSLATPQGLTAAAIGNAPENLSGRADARDMENLRAAAAGKPNPNSNFATGAMRAASDFLGMGKSAATPEGTAIAAGSALAPEVAAPIFLAHGGYKATKAAVNTAHEGFTPENARDMLLGAGEAVGGAAMGKAVLDNPSPGVSFLKNALQTARGAKLAPADIDAARPEGAFQPALKNTPREVLQHAEQEGIRLTPFQGTESKLAGKLQVAGEHGVVGGQSLENAMGAERAKFGESVNRMSERVDPTRLGLSEEQAGEAIQHSAQTAKDVAHQNASDAYKNLPGTKTTPVDPRPISDKWLSLRESLPVGVEDQILGSVPRNMRASVEEMLSPTGMKAPLTFEQAGALRSFFREMGDTEGLPNRLEGAFKQLSKAADSAMERAAAKGGFEQEWRNANQGWKDYAEKYGNRQSPLYKILQQKDPAAITRSLMNRASAKDIETLNNEGMTEALEPLRRQVIQDIARNKFRVGRDGLGGYQDSFLNQLFGRQGTKELYLKADLARRMNWEPNPSGTGGTLLASEQLSKPSKIAQFFGAAKLSMPREASTFLPSAHPNLFDIRPGLVTPATLQRIREQTQ